MEPAAPHPGDAGLLGWAHSMTGGVAENDTFWILTAALAVGLACLAAHAALLARTPRAHRESPRELWIAFALFAAALLIRLLAPPWTHYTFNDEYAYLRAAAELRSSGTFSLRNQPPLLVYLYALAFSVFPATAQTTSAITAVAGSLTVAALYGCLRALNAGRSVSVVAALLLALNPLHVKHSGASSLEVMSLLFVVSAVGTFARWIRRPTWLALVTFSFFLFAALTTRTENFLLVPVLSGLALIAPVRALEVPKIQLVVPAVAVLVATIYLPGVLAFHGEQDPWWKSELSLPALMWNNLGFWTGGRELGWLPLLVLLAGLLRSSRTDRQACIAWLGLFFAYSAVYAVHGANLGYHVESAQPAYFASRQGGHDMFRFNVMLLPAICFFLASGIVASVRVTAALVRRVAGHEVPGVAPALTLVVAAVWILLAGTHRIDPRPFLHSPYNRPIEVAEFDFLQTHLGAAVPPVRCYTFPASTEPFLGDGIDVAPIERPADIRLGAGSTFFYVTSAQLFRADRREELARVARRFHLDEVARRRVGPVELRLFRVRTGRAPAHQADRARGNVSHTAPMGGADAASTRRTSASRIPTIGGPQGSAAAAPPSPT